MTRVSRPVPANRHSPIVPIINAVNVVYFAAGGEKPRTTENEASLLLTRLSSWVGKISANCGGPNARADRRFALE
jgi:hypothetical protein